MRQVTYNKQIMKIFKYTGFRERLLTVKTDNLIFRPVKSNVLMI